MIEVFESHELGKDIILVLPATTAEGVGGLFATTYSLLLDWLKSSILRKRISTSSSKARPTVCQLKHLGIRVIHNLGALPADINCAAAMLSRQD